MLLHDLVPITKRKSVNDLKIVSTFDELFAQYDSLKVGSKLLDNQGDILSKAGKVVAERGQAARREVFLKTLTLPTSMKQAVATNYNGLSRSDDVLTTLAETPVTQMEKIRQVADALEMIIVPFEFLNPAAYRDEDNWMQGAIKGFAQATAGVGLTPFVVTPLSFYSVQNHAKAKNPNQPIYGGSLQTVVTSITLSIPMFRSLMAEIEGIKGQAASLENRVNDQLGGMQRQIEMLQAQVKKNQEEAARAIEAARAEAAKARAEAAAAQKAAEEMRFWANDPMMFAMAGDDLLGSAQVLMGPCWGGEFSPYLAEAKGLTTYKSQRAAVKDAIRPLVSSRSYY